jgi:hypothetical protein
METSEIYLQTLLSYYEDEIMGEAYFYGLARHFDECEKLVLLARVERRAAESIRPLLDKYDLTPRNESKLRILGESHVERHRSYTWPGFMEYIVKRYPGYLEEFKALECMAPDEDLYALSILTDHEVVAIEFAEKEIAEDPNSLAPLHEYLRQ